MHIIRRAKGDAATPPSQGTPARSDEPKKEFQMRDKATFTSLGKQPIAGEWVEVCDSMVHGGPYPASTNFGHTSVGTLSIRRFLRPVCYQNMAEGILPEDLR